MRRRDLLGLLGGALAAAPRSGATQQQKVPMIGLLLHGSERVIPQVLTEALRDLGYIDGRNIRLEIRSAGGDVQRLPGLANELVSRKPDVIVATITPSVLAARKATGEIPIVMTYVADPVGGGIVASLAHPGGNVTGLSSLAVEAVGKQVELLHEAVPNAQRFAVLYQAGSSVHPMLEQIVSAGETQRIAIEPSFVATGSAPDNAFAAMMAGHRVDGVIVEGLLSSERVAELALRHRLPAVSDHPFFARQGGLIGYFASPQDNARRAAVLIDKILKGAKPTDLPVEQPTKFELVINLKTAKALGLTVPPSLLARADEVIE